MGAIHESTADHGADVADGDRAAGFQSADGGCAAQSTITGGNDVHPEHQPGAAQIDGLGGGEWAEGESVNTLDGDKGLNHEGHEGIERGANPEGGKTAGKC